MAVAKEQKEGIVNQPTVEWLVNGVSAASGACVVGFVSALS